MRAPADRLNPALLKAFGAVENLKTAAKNPDVGRIISFSIFSAAVHSL
jgi:hypothetical protein